ncbi:hypothetical protein GmHk_17G049042 [Glycine max]|nr:hypothetical protein GmHk_17G049042 [Glycine max]
MLFDVRKKAHAYQKQNTTSHVLSRGGYDFLEQKLMEEKKNKLLEEAAQFGSTNIVVDPPYPIRQHVKWKMTHMEKIRSNDDSLEKQALQGSFAAHEHQDVVTATIGQPEHPGCVRAAGVDVMIKHYFGPASRGSCTSSSMVPDDLEQLIQKIRD